MRVAAYTGGVMVPSARARIRQYIEPLSRHGIAVREYPLPWGNILPQSQKLRPTWMAATALSRMAALTHSWNAHATWVSRQLLPAFVPLHAMAKRPLILDVDDAVWLNTGGRRSASLARASDLVVCGNSFLATHFSRWNRNITIIPTAVNTSWYRPNPLRAEGGPIFLGWTGTSGNFPFLYSIEAALLKVLQQCRRAKLLIVADRPPQFRNIPVNRFRFQRWDPDEELVAFSRMAVGLMPLADNDWCSGKCSYKMLCYMASGLPVVVTPTGMNQEVLALGNVGLPASSEREWVDSLVSLIENADLRRRMGATGRAVVETRFSLDRLAQQYAALFESLGGASRRDPTLPNVTV